MKLRISMVTMCAIIISGCGTLKTNFNTDADIRNGLVRYHSNCTEMARVYSGLLYDLCLLNGTPNDPVKQIYLGYYYFDTIPSVVLDTAFLPYTLYQQYSVGNLSVRSPK